MSKLKSSRKKWWTLPANFRKRIRYKKFPEILAYEEHVVMAGLIQHGKPVTAKELCDAFPGRYSGSKPVAAVLKRLAEHGRASTAQEFSWRTANWRLEHQYIYFPNYTPQLPNVKNKIKRKTSIAKG